ncbi:MAG: L,D-transpeptidase [Patescibacteria group bacterium]
MAKIITYIFFIFFCSLPVNFANAQLEIPLATEDNDSDGLNDLEEVSIYRTDPKDPDSDNDGYLDGVEIKYNYDPNKNGDDVLLKEIFVNLASQELTYSLGPYKIRTIKVSTGLSRTPTPKGEFAIIKKPPLVNYRGVGYNYPNTRWNMLFKTSPKGGYYIHGAYWHNNFGNPMSHGCVNVSYREMEPLYNWADEGIRVIIE